MFKTLAFLAVLLGGFFSPAFGQQPVPCAPGNPETAIKKEYGEKKIASGINARGTKIIFFGNHKTKTFSLVLYFEKQGMFCLVESGNNFILEKKGKMIRYVF